MSYPEEPACWSWRIPPLRDAAEEVERHLALQVGLPRDYQMDRAALEMGNGGLVSMQAVRFLEFHTGVRDTPGERPLARCAICGRHFEQAALVTDHDHATGLERGYLCRSCNTREGYAKNGGAFAGYRQRHPALILGYQKTYSGVDAVPGWMRETAAR